MDLVSINLGQTGGDKKGDPLREAFRIHNQNMDVIADALTGLPTAGDLADVVAQIPAISTVTAAIEGVLDNETVSPEGLKAHFDSRLASKPEAEAGSNDTKTMTPLRSKQAIVKRVVTPEDYSGGLQEAIDAARNVEGRPGASYTHTGIVLSHSDSFDARNAIVTAGVGSRIYELSGFGSSLERLYIANNVASTDWAIRLNTGRYMTVSNVISPNTGVGGMRIAPDTGNIAISRVAGARFEGITGTGISIGSSTVEVNASGIYCGGKIDYDGSGKGRPRAGTIGWRQNTPIVGGFDTGGHQIYSCNMIAVATGWHLTDANLTTFTDCIGDSTRGYGVIIDGASNRLTFNSLFVGASMGIKVAGTSQNIMFDGLETELIGTIPPWGQNPFYDSAGPYYAVTVEDAAQVTIDGNSWRGDKRVSVAPGAKLTVTGGVWLKARTSNVAAASTGYMCEFGSTGAEGDAIWRAPHDGYLFFMEAVPVAAPGVGESFTYTARVNFADAAMVVTLSGAGALIGKTYGPIAVTEGQAIAIKIVTSAGAAATRHFVNLQLLAR